MKDSVYSDVRVRLQEIINYAESRFRSILVNVNKYLIKKDVDQISWTQKLLNRELVGYSCLFRFCYSVSVINRDY